MQISKESTYVTLINVFETTPDKQQELIDSWLRSAQAMQDDPGLIATALHKSIDGTHVINYAQWKSQEDHENFVNQHREDFAQFTQYASFNPHLYNVVYLFEKPEEK